MHWPFCQSKCPYCDFNSHVRENVEHEEWRRSLLMELRYFLAKNSQKKIRSIFFGGGTPSLMEPETISAIILEANRLNGFTDDIEITMEANPSSVEAHRFRDYKSAGINRVSLGVQSLDDAELHFLGRRHNKAEALQAIEIAANNFSRYSFDLIYALYSQTPDSWHKSLLDALQLKPQHISLYQLTIEENTNFYHRHKAGNLPVMDESMAAELYLATGDILSQHNLMQYEISNYAVVGNESRHNLAYWRYQDYIGIGPGAHGRYSDELGRKIATQTIRSPEKWLAAVSANGHGLDSSEVLSSQHIAEEFILMGMRLKEGMNLQNLAGILNIDVTDVLTNYIDQPALSRLISQGYINSGYINGGNGGNYIYAVNPAYCGVTDHLIRSILL